MTGPLSSQLIESALSHCKPPKHIYIGYSGGVDSHVLLHLCVANLKLKPLITAVYVHHGLQLAADDWATHCQKTASQLGVHCQVLHVDAKPMLGESPEEAARNARYSALKTLMKCDDVLLVAQHRDDQLETVFLQLLRGSGLRGLSAMPENTALGLGRLLRPLLNVAKPAIDAYAQVNSLIWVEDPSNQSHDYDRNYLRNAILPLLKQRWPACDKTVARSARHCADAQVMISAVSEQLFLHVFNKDDQTLIISQLIIYPAQEQALIIRHWFLYLKLKMPSSAFIERVQSELLNARLDSDPIVARQHYCVRRYRAKLYCLPTLISSQFDEITWPTGQLSLTLSNQNAWTCVPSSAGISRALWQHATIKVCMRQGGEKIRLPGRSGHHSLKKLFQEADIPTWEREVLPLIYLNDKLAAVADLWISADFYSEDIDNCLTLQLQSSLES
jgi:tRNA(Ile)-lysidine synthase